VWRPENTVLAIFFGAACLITWWVSDHVFFWDTIQLGAKHALFYYENGLNLSLLPAEIDSGHPPLFGYYLALCWTLFGKTLAVSHLAMLPFLLGIIFMAFRLNSILAATIPVWMLCLLLFADPVLAAQSILVSPDIPLVFFFLLGIFSILRYKPGWLSLAIIGLGLISLRGMMCGLVLFAWEFMTFRPRLRTLLPYLPGGLLAAVFLVWHYAETGWIGYHAESPWAPSFERSDTNGLLRNAAILVWRLLDFGRIFLWLSLAFLLYKFKTINPLSRQLAWLFLLAVLILSPSLLLHKALSAHRYLLPVFLSLSLLFISLLSGVSRPKKPWIYALAVVGFLSGNFWIYPTHIAQGWDASLAHLPYYNLRHEALRYMKQKNIPLADTGTAFPEIGALKFRDLSAQEAGLKEKNLATDRYILWSNVMNDFSDAETQQLRERWLVLQRWQAGGITLILYQRPL
jgi:hypothetical protein